MSDQPRTTRRDLLKPVQLLGFAFAAAAFGGIITLVSMGFFQAKPAEDIQRAVIVALIVAGVSFIATLVGLALLLLAVDPAQVSKPVDRAVLLDPEVDEAPDGTASPDTHH